MAAEVTGVLTFDETENCLRMELEGVAYPLVWPAGTRWHDDPPAVVLANGDRVEPGMTVYGGGGYVSTANLEASAGPTVAAAAQHCLGPSGEVAFFNVGSEVEVIVPGDEG